MLLQSLRCINSSSVLYRSQTLRPTRGQVVYWTPISRRVATSSSTPPSSSTIGAIGSIAGFLGSLAGMGGGFVMIPLMTSSIGRISQHQAHGTSLFAVAATGLAGAASYRQHVDVPAALAVTATALLTSRLGANTTVALSERTLQRALGVLMLVMAPAVPAKAYFLEEVSRDKKDEAELDTRKRTDGAAVGSGSASTSLAALLHRSIPPALVGLVSGYLSGLLGVGGGVIVVPALTVSCPDLSHTQALATSLAAMTLPAVVGTYTHAVNGTCALAVAPYLALGALAGAYLGGQVSLQMEESRLRWGFAGLLTVLGVRTLLLKT